LLSGCSDDDSGNGNNNNIDAAVIDAAGGDAAVADGSSSDSGAVDGSATDGGGGADGGGETEVQGTVNGHGLNASEALFVIDNDLIPGDELITVSDRSGSCTTPDYTFFGGSTYLLIDFMGVGQVTGPGTYPVVGTFYVLNNTCQPSGSGFMVDAISGQVILNSVDLSSGGVVTGTLDMDFGAAGSLTGSFTAAVCRTDYWGSNVCSP
jgi:hypothetical protein